MNTDVKGLLSNLKRINDANTVSIKVPSTNKKSNFKLTSFAQQKELLRTAFDGVSGLIKRTNVFNKLVTENCTDEVEFLLIDRDAILIEIRKATIGSKYTHKDKDYDLNTLEPLRKSSLKFEDSITEEDITINVSIPTLELDTEVNNKMLTELAKFTSEEEKVKQSIDSIVLYETSKFIKDVTVGEQTIKFSDISAYERKEVVANLPVKINRKVLDFIAAAKEVTDKAATLDEEVLVEIDASFLSTD